MPEPKTESVDTLIVRAGGIARKGAKTDPATTGELVARPFRHPALKDRVVVRLVEDSLDAALLAEMAVLGFAEAGAKVAVGRTRKRALGFPAWALVNHPTKARFALEIMKEFRRASARVRAKPGHAKDAFVAIGKRLERSVPAFMPSYWEEVARVFLAEDATSFASQAFEKARTAEREFKLPVDEDLRAAAYLEFAAVGAVPAKSLAGYADDLVRAFGPREGERRFVQLNVQRIKAGMPPWTGMGKELAKLAKAAATVSRPAKAEPEGEPFLQQIIGAPSLKKAPPDFWATYRPQLMELARSSPEALRQVVWLFPEPRGFATFLPTWLELLHELGAVEAVLASGEAARWLAALTRFVTFSDEWGDRETPLPARYFELLTRLAPALAESGAALDLASYQRWGDDGSYAPDVLEAALELGLTLAPPKGESPDVALGDFFARDPLRLVAHPEYGKLLVAAVGAHFGRDDFEARAKGKQGLVTARRDHLLAMVAKLSRGALPQLKDSLETLTESTTAATFAEFPEAAAAIAEVDVGAALARTLVGGLFDELTWPELEAALAELRGPKGEIELHGTRQHPLLRSGRRVIVFEGRRRLKDYDLPAAVKEPGQLAYLDGDLLIGYHDAKANENRALWASRPKAPFPVHMRLRGIVEAVALAGGGVTLGGAPLHAGDTPDKIKHEPFASDGQTFWLGRASWHERLKLTELDPATGKPGRASWPAFARAASEQSDGMSLLEVQLMPLRGADGSLAGHHDGLVGHYVRRDAEGENYELVRIDGERCRVGFKPDALLDWPGGGGARALAIGRAWSDDESDTYSLCPASAPDAGAGEEDLKTGSFGGDEWPSVGFSLLPREAWLHYLSARDEASSAALRAVTPEVARELVMAAAEDPPADDDDDQDPSERDAQLTHALAAVRARLPRVTDPVLQRAVARLARVAAERAGELAELQHRGEDAGGGVTDDQVAEALPLLPTEGYDDGFVTTDMTIVADALLDGKRGKLTGSRVLWERHVEHLAKLACLIASRHATGPAERETLRALLTALRECRLLGQTVTRAELSVKTGSPLLTRPKGMDTWLASEGDALLFVRVVDEDEDEPTQRVSVLALGAELPTPKDATLTSRQTVSIPDDRAFIRELLEELSARGPAAHDPEAVAQVAAETSLTPAEVAIVLAGLPSFDQYRSDFLGKELRATLGLKVTDAARAKEKLRALPDGQLLALVLGTASVGAASAFWAPASDPGGVAQALARTARALFGKSIVLREDLVTRVDKECTTELGARRALTLLLTATDPENPWLTPRKGPVPWNDLGDSGNYFCVDVISTTAALIPYLAGALPVGDPYLRAIPALYAAVTKLLALPDLLLPLGERDEENPQKRAALLEQIGGKKVTLPGPPDETREARDNGLVIAVDAGYDTVSFAVHTAQLRERRAALLPYLVHDDPDDEVYGLEGARSAYYLLSKECEELVARISETPLPEGAYEANPQLSAPAELERLRVATGLDADAAALYLQLLTLPNPTKKSLLTFNAWRPAQYDKAAAALVKKKLVVEGKRERTGRDIFLPGGWDKQSRGVSMETYKRALYDRVSFDDDEPQVSTPLHAAYARAVERWLGGERPGFEDVGKRKK